MFKPVLFFLTLVMLIGGLWSAKPVFAVAEIGADIGSQLNAAGNGIGISEPVDPRVSVMLIIRFGLRLLGLVVFCFILYAGFVWLTSGGNSEKVGKAQKILRNSIIGLCIIIASYSITILALNIALGKTGGFWEQIFGR
jgi:hypothetical protein